MADLLLSTTALRSPGKRKCLIQCGATWSAILLQVSHVLLMLHSAKPMSSSSHLGHTAGDLYAHIDQAARLLVTLIYSISIY